MQTIYIDPPFNKEQDADYFYSVKYKDSSWVTLLENRLRLAKDALKDTGSVFVRCDYNGNMLVRLLMNEIFGEENFRNEIIINRTQEFFKFAQGLNKFMVDIDTLFFWAKTDKSQFNEIRIKRDIDKWWQPFLPGKPKNEEDKYRLVLGRRIESPKGRKWGLKQAQIEELEKEEKIKIENGKVKYVPSGTTLKNNWTDIPGYSRGWGFLTENSEILLKRVLESTSSPHAPLTKGGSEGGIILDFFLGSGTTTAVAHKLKRKWLGVEMGEHFYTVVLPRMKKVLAGDKSGISREVNWQGGGFFKYYELEQYEDALRKAKYEDSDLFEDPYQDPYNQYVFLRDLKMLEALEVDLEQNKVKVDLAKLYPVPSLPLRACPERSEGTSIDIAETLSNRTGKWIKRITPDFVEFADGERVDLKNLDWKLIKPLIWW